MKLKIVAVVVTGLLAANVAHAAEVYNKDGNKLDLYGKGYRLTLFRLMISVTMVIKLMPVSALKEKRKSMIK